MLFFADSDDFGSFNSVPVIMFSMFGSMVALMFCCICGRSLCKSRAWREAMRNNNNRCPDVTYTPQTHQIPTVSGPQQHTGHHQYYSNSQAHPYCHHHHKEIVSHAHHQGMDSDIHHHHGIECHHTPGFLPDYPPPPYSAEETTFQHVPQIDSCTETAPRNDSVK